MKKHNYMPVLFVGHGSPMNAIEDNSFTQGWQNIAKLIPKPKAILMISAHWYTQNERIFNGDNPKMIYDMYGFPEELYQTIYKAKGSIEVSTETYNILKPKAIIDNSWGLDHGGWSVLIKMYPEANIPVFQMSVASSMSTLEQYEIGKKIKKLRNQGVLIIGSGNIVHNLKKVDFSTTSGFEWAKKFDSFIKKSILNKDHKAIIDAQTHKEYTLAVPTPDHFSPLLYVLGASDIDDEILVFNEVCTLGALSMTSYLFK